MAVDTAGAEQRGRCASRLGEPEGFAFPAGWSTSSSWHRAQAAESTVGAVNPAEFDVLLGRLEGDASMSRHRVLFALYEGELRAECDCDGHRYRSWCAHVALLWWRWCNAELAVTDLDTGRTHLSPPWWLSVDDADCDRVDAETRQPAVADGGSNR